ncbi:conserved hypothetical protein [Rhodococcus jostii RHA1]|uniref:Uncharacterized protein n=1 Tax=Rhodococcus jostii (strain RHA1) TaxID=101510 RepID=Q0SBM9_RHOJR|nr:conserved hypothetical protein [Rhodococcus jostii RHA1]
MVAGRIDRAEHRTGAAIGRIDDRPGSGCRARAGGCGARDGERFDRLAGRNGGCSCSGDRFDRLAGRDGGGSQRSARVGGDGLLLSTAPRRGQCPERRRLDRNLWVIRQERTKTEGAEHLRHDAGCDIHRRGGQRRGQCLRPDLRRVRTGVGYPARQGRRPVDRGDRGSHRRNCSRNHCRRGRDGSAHCRALHHGRRGECRAEAARHRGGRWVRRNGAARRCAVVTLCGCRGRGRIRSLGDCSRRRPVGRRDRGPGHVDGVRGRGGRTRSDLPGLVCCRARIRHATAVRRRRAVGCRGVGWRAGVEGRRAGPVRHVVRGGGRGFGARGGVGIGAGGGLRIRVRVAGRRRSGSAARRVRVGTRCAG